ncbi:MAG: tRNA lysidine(34) synthetase TilS [Muribaculaceae bacterium]|nr:tRNA lysidine(34) synthetase TilS [Muribaculaceae bacterium]
MNKNLKLLKDFESSIKQYSRNHNITKVIVALSGGADSVGSALALKNIGIEILALHCNFHLRGEESNRDMAFVKEFCAQNNIPLEIKEFDVEQYRSDLVGVSVEMACRDLRHQWFQKKLEETGYQRIVTGHNADDNIETFFLNLLRGCGSRGLKGMTVDNGKIWRPLLRFHRPNILEYLKQYNQNFVLDSTNLENDFRRNYLRNVIIPLLKKEWKGFDTALDKTISNIEIENRIVEDVVSLALPLPLEPLSVAKITESSAPLLLLKRYIEPAGPFINTHEEILSAIKANKPHIRRWQLKKGIVILRNGNLFIEMSHGEART